MLRPTTLSLLLLLSAPLSAFGQLFDDDFNAWPRRTSLGGTVAIMRQPTGMDRLAVLLRQPTAETQIIVLADAETKMGTLAALQESFATARFTFGLLNAGSVKSTLSDDDRPDLLVLLTPAGVTPEGLSGQADSLSEYIGSGGRVALVGGVSYLAGQKVVGEKTAAGLNLLPMDIQQSTPAFDQAALLPVLAATPRTVGLHVSPDALLVVRNRIARIVGDGQSSFLLPSGPHHEVRLQTLREPARGQRPPQYLVDWTEWRRDSIDHTLPKFPPDKPPVPHVDKGTLLIVGGGGMPDGLMERFVELAGGKDAKLVYIPCTEEREVSPQQGMVRWWQRLGVASAVTVHTKDRDRANSDAKFLAPLHDATGVWFGGGRQWNMADSYYGTHAQQLMKNVLTRGGVIGGSSAGASIQARYLARATPIENFRIMAPGYERGGLGFIGGVAIDQHFSQRGRQKDMTSLVNRYPQMLGIGLDEATAIEVQASRATVTGRGRVFFYDRNTRSADDTPDYVALPAGGAYDLAARRVLVNPETETETETETDQPATSAPTEPSSGPDKAATAQPDKQPAAAGSDGN